MKKPYEIHSDFFKKMIASGWYENREIILDSLPHYLEELPDNVKKFLREIWYFYEENPDKLYNDLKFIGTFKDPRKKYR